MPEFLWAILIGSVLLGLIGLIWNAQQKRINDLEDWKRDKEKLDYDFRHREYAPSIAAINLELLPLVERSERLTQDCHSLRAFNDEHLPAMLDGIKSDCYGTIANHKADIEKRFERIERKVFNGNHGA